jgi:hypothetical protein
MNTTKIYRRTSPQGTENLTIKAFIAEKEGDRDGDEIRVIHAIDGVVVTDRIAFYGPGGRQWMRTRHDSWTADGFELVSSGPDL